MEAPASERAKVRRAAFVHSPELQRYHYPPDCPFKTERAGKTHAVLDSMGLLSGDGRRLVAPAPAGEETLREFHSPAYLEALRRAPQGHLDVEALRMGIGTPDCPVFAGMYEQAALACGGTLTGAGLILDGQTDVAFNPSGGFHHAGPAKAAGFCYLNDVVLACLHLRRRFGRVLFLDVDAHHGDGVQEAFYARADVMTISFHESGRTLFPGSGFEGEIGTGAGTGYCVNVPLPAGTCDVAFLRAFHALAEPLLTAYAPEAIVLELGMDALAGDPLAHLSLTNNAHAEVIGTVLARDVPVLATGGGGYHVENTVRGWARAWSIFVGADDPAGEMSLGLGGVMLQSTEWPGGLRDRALAPPARQRRAVDAALAATIEKVRANVFGFHGL